MRENVLDGEILIALNDTRFNTYINMRAPKLTNIPNTNYCFVKRDGLEDAGYIYLEGKGSEMLVRFRNDNMAEVELITFETSDKNTCGSFYYEFKNMSC